MRLLYSPVFVEIELEEGKNCILQVENSMAYSEFVSDIFSQINGGEGDSIISVGEKILDIKKNVELILEPFTIDLNNRKLRNKLLQDVSEIAIQDYYAEFQNLCMTMQEYMEKLSCTFPFAISYNGSVSIEDFLKIENINFDYEYENVAEKLCVYLKLMSEACGIKIFIIVDIQRYLENNEIIKLLETMSYNKINIIFIASSAWSSIPENCDLYVLDKDCCFWKV